MATKTDHRGLSEGTSKDVNGSMELHVATSGRNANGFDEASTCQMSPVNADAHEDVDVSKASVSGSLSPTSLRRSTRACALKAAERIKFKEETANSHDADEDECDIEPACKKKRFANDEVLDQTDCKFGIKIEDEEVVLMSDESELSSLNEAEYDHVKKAYDKTLSKEQNEEQRKERELIVKTLEAELRKEEAKLAVLRKLRSSQQLSVKQVQDANTRKLTANVVQNGSGNAYKPPVASSSHNRSANNASTKGTNSVISSRAAATAAAALLGISPQQVLQNVTKNGLLNSATAQALLQQAHANGRISSQQAAALAAAAALSQQQQQQQQQQQTSHSRATAAVTPVVNKESAAQKAAAAKSALRRQLEQQLLQIPPPRPPPPDVFFIPNSTQPDFLCLLGLDIAVQRLLKDKNATKNVTEKPYVCEECGTDFTPTWRAVGPDESSLHLYCEACVKAAQKKKMRQEHTAVLRRAFNKIIQKEQELDKQIAESKTRTMPQCSTSRSEAPAVTSSQTTVTAKPSISSVASTSASKTVSNQHHAKSNSQQKRVSSANNSSNMGGGNSSSSPQPNSSVAAAAAAIAAAAGVGSSSSLLQQQLVAAAALRSSNPMLAAMMSNPLLNGPNMLQMHWNPLMPPRMPNMAMTALAQAVQNAHQSAAAVSTANAAPAAAPNPLAALAASINPAAAAAMFGNPQMVRQLQQVHQAMQRNFLLEYAKSQPKK